MSLEKELFAKDKNLALHDISLFQEKESTIRKNSKRS